mgnify:CR=1 FL=1
MYIHIKFIVRISHAPSQPHFLFSVFSMRGSCNGHGSYRSPKCLSNRNKSLRTNHLVDLYLRKICEVQRNEDAKLALWFVLIPTKIYDTCNASCRRQGILQLLPHGSNIDRIWVTPESKNFFAFAKAFKKSSCSFLRIERLSNAPLTVGSDPKL